MKATLAHKLVAVKAMKCMHDISWLVFVFSHMNVQTQWRDNFVK